MWRRVDLVWTDVSEERIASIFRVEESTSEEPAWAGLLDKWHISALILSGELQPADGKMLAPYIGWPECS
jgi:hypothetical protein